MFRGLLRPVRLQRQRAQQIQRVAITGRQPQRLAIALLGVVQSPSLMQAQAETEFETDGAHGLVAIFRSGRRGRL
jgi:hypothetical protein